MSRPPRLGKKFSRPTLSRLINGDIELAPEQEQVKKTRLDHVLVEKYPQYNRATIQKLVKSGSVTVNGKVTTKVATRILETDKIEVEEGLLGGLKAFARCSPEKNLLPPRIIYEDDNVLVLDKPSGLLSMSKGEYNPEPTLENYGLLVHRLDRDTSGVVILAKNEEAQTYLRKQFQDRKAHKVYYAVVEGHPDPMHAIIDIPLARNFKRPTTFQPDPKGKEAITEYKVIEENDKYSLLELRPTTGRTHQLRVHLAHIGTSILGDEVYGPKKQTASRLFLHAHSLEISIPAGSRKTFTSPLPEEFANVFRKS